MNSPHRRPAKLFLSLATLFGLVLTGTVLTASSASAHSIADAVAAGCGSTYRAVDSEAMRGASGAVVGQIILAQVAGTQRFCGLTNKVASHGSPTYTYVCLAHRGLADDTCRSGNVGHFQNITAWNGQNRCIILRGRFRTTNNVWASAETLLLRPNGASCA